MKRKNMLILIFGVLLALSLAACGSDTKNETPQEPASQSTADNPETDSAKDTTNQAQDDATEPQGQSVLVVFFSATGTTKGVAERIADLENADLYEITAAQPYTADDLDYNDPGSRTTLEQDDSSVRPEISGETLDLSGYTVIYIGYPIWWGEEPRIMDTFVESYDFGNITMIPFCTSGGSGIGRSGSNLAENAGSGNWQSGDRLQGSISDADLQAWIDGYK